MKSTTERQGASRRYCRPAVCSDHPRPIYDNFRGLFQAINRGNAALGIHTYNGGLFAEDPSLDSLRVSDEVCGYFRDLGDYDYRPAHQTAFAAGGDRLIDVEILGHISEQSITDLERLRNELDGLVEPAGPDKYKTRRKKEGAFYTPSFITRYIIEQALGGAPIEVDPLQLDVLGISLQQLRGNGHFKISAFKGGPAVASDDPHLGEVGTCRVEFHVVLASPQGHPGSIVTAAGYPPFHLQIARTGFERLQPAEVQANHDLGRPI